MRFEKDNEGVRKELSEHFLEMVRSVGSYTKMTVSGLAFKANVHRNTVYYHFRNMEEVTLWTLHDMISSVPEGPGLKEHLISVFTRQKKFLDYAKYLLGTEKFTSVLTGELMHPVGSCFAELPEGEDKKRVCLMVSQQIVMAYITFPRPQRALETVFDCIIPGIREYESKR